MSSNAKWHGDKFIKITDEAAKAHIMKMGDWVEAEAKKLCPVDTGNLRSSIHTKYNSEEFAAYVGTNKESMSKASSTGSSVFYAPYVEYGHKLRNGEFYPARPFLRPALDVLRVKRGKV